MGQFKLPLNGRLVQISGPLIGLYAKNGVRSLCIQGGWSERNNRFCLAGSICSSILVAIAVLANKFVSRHAATPGPQIPKINQHLARQVSGNPKNSKQSTILFQKFDKMKTDELVRMSI